MFRKDTVTSDDQIRVALGVEHGMERRMRREEIARWKQVRIVEKVLDVRLDVSHADDCLDWSLRIDRVQRLHIEASSMSDRSWRNHVTAQ
jgi:hypothetical protein